MASKHSYIRTIARANSLRFSTIFQEIKVILEARDKSIKSSRVFGIAIEAYCKTLKQGGNPLKRLHRKDIWTWDIEQLLAIPERVSAENVAVHNKIAQFLRDEKKEKNRAKDKAQKAKRAGKPVAKPAPVARKVPVWA